jgi:predicted GNAT superfamily acetyltransferase
MEAFVAVEDLQLLVWGDDLRSLVPAHMFYLITSTGGILLGAYAGGKLIGFVAGLLGRREGRLYHASHMLGIHPDYQGGGVGAALKWRQRERVLEQGLELMTWTFDPLQARNAHFNLHKLGAVSRTYRENQYGEMSDSLNRGLPSDRLYVDWWLRDLPPSRPALRETVQILSDHGGKPTLSLVADALGTPLLVEVPKDVQRLKREDAETALAWRLAARQALSWAFSHGYAVRDFVHGSYVLVPDDGRDGAR